MSESFIVTDRFHTDWDLKIDLAIALEINKSDYSEITPVKFDFLAPEKEFFGAIYSNRGLAMALVWTIVQDQVKEKLIPTLPENILAEYKDGSIPNEVLELYFIKRFDGDALAKAHQTIIRAIADFFPDQRTGLLTLLRKMELAHAKAEMELQHLDPTLDQLINEEIDSTMKEVQDQLRKPRENKAISIS